MAVPASALLTTAFRPLAARVAHHLKRLSNVLARRLAVTAMPALRIEGAGAAG
jgi:hypothetical protein